MTWTVVKQYFVTGSNDPDWAEQSHWWAQLSGSETQTYSFDSEQDAWEKAVELQDEDSTGRKYKAIKL